MTPLPSQVSWIRARDLHILTTGLFTFTKDMRFVAFNTNDTWTLKLLGPRVSDSGRYLCQVSTEPRISQTFELTVRGQLGLGKVSSP